MTAFDPVPDVRGARPSLERGQRRGGLDHGQLGRNLDRRSRGGTGPEERLRGLAVHDREWWCNAVRIVRVPTGLGEPAAFDIHACTGSLHGDGFGIGSGRKLPLVSDRAYRRARSLSSGDRPVRPTHPVEKRFP